MCVSVRGDLKCKFSGFKRVRRGEMCSRSYEVHCPLWRLLWAFYLDGDTLMGTADECASFTTFFSVKVVGEGRMGALLSSKNTHTHTHGAVNHGPRAEFRFPILQSSPNMLPSETAEMGETCVVALATESANEAPLCGQGANSSLVEHHRPIDSPAGWRNSDKNNDENPPVSSSKLLCRPLVVDW